MVQDLMLKFWQMKENLSAYSTLKFFALKCAKNECLNRLKHRARLSCNAQNLEGKEVTVNATSGASVKIHATQKLNSIRSSGASVRYNGKPEPFASSNSSGGSTKPIE